MLKFHDIPAVAGPYGPAKTMIIMHGRGDVKESFIPFTKELNLTGLSYRLLDAPHTFMFGHSWYAAAPNDPFPDIEHAIVLIEEHIKNLRVDPRDLFLAGFSQGAAMALEFALNSSHTFAGVVAMSPRIFIRPELLGKAKHCQTPIFMAHGTHDEMIPFAETQANAQKLFQQGIKIDFHAYEMNHEIDIMEVQALREWMNERL